MSAAENLTTALRTELRLLRDLESALKDLNRGIAADRVDQVEVANARATAHLEALEGARTTRQQAVAAYAGRAMSIEVLLETRDGELDPAVRAAIADLIHGAIDVSKVAQTSRYAVRFADRANTEFLKNMIAPADASMGYSALPSDLSGCVVNEKA